MLAHLLLCLVFPNMCGVSAELVDGKLTNSGSGYSVVIYYEAFGFKLDA